MFYGTCLNPEAVVSVSFDDKVTDTSRRNVTKTMNEDVKLYLLKYQL